MALDETIPIDGDGITTGTRVSEICAAIRTLRVDVNVIINSRCRYTKNDAQAIANTTWTPVEYDDIDFDTLSEWDVDPWTFTANNEGYYQVNAGLRMASAAWATNEGVILAIYKNGTRYTEVDLDFADVTTTYFRQVSGSDIVYLNGTTDYIDIRVWHNQDAPVNTDTTATFNYVSIHRLS